MKKILCVIDTSSYINLDSFAYYKGTLLDLLSKKAIFRISSEVNYEIGNHYSVTMPIHKRRINQVHHPKRYFSDEYQNRLWDSIRQREQGSKGEIENFIVMLDMFLDQQGGNLVFLTDDFKALNGILKEVKQAFPYCSIWNSFDVVLFVYLSYQEFTYDAAKNAIQHIYGTTATDDNRMDPKKNEERAKRRDVYFRLLERVRSIKQR